jgi:hypothetical protein
MGLKQAPKRPCDRLPGPFAQAEPGAHRVGKVDKRRKCALDQERIGLLGVFFNNGRSSVARAIRSKNAQGEIAEPLGIRRQLA